MSLAAISVSADLEDLWFLGDLLGIFSLSATIDGFFFGFFGSLAPASLVSLASVGSVSLVEDDDEPDDMMYCG